MPRQYHEKCLTCEWFDPSIQEPAPPCGRVFKGRINITPRGGSIDWDFLPGMVPVEWEERFRSMLTRIGDFIQSQIDRWPLWKDYVEDMQSKGKQDCPGREEKKNPFLRVVKANDILGKEECSTCIFSSGCSLDESYDPSWKCPQWKSYSVVRR